MPGAIIEIDDHEILAALRELTHRVSDVRPALREIGEHLHRTTKERFRAEESPDGVPWAELRDVTLQHKTRNADKILVESGEMMNNSLSYDVSLDELIFGSNAIQARVMQEGATQGAFGRSSRNGPLPWGNIPARPFIGISADDKDNILEILRDYINDAIR